MRFHDPELAALHADVVPRLLEELSTYSWTDVDCVVCAEPGPTTRRYEKHGIAMRACDRCGHLFVSPRLPEAAVADLYGSRYWEEYVRAIGSPTLEERARFDHENGLSKLRRDVLPYRRSGRLLDVGASSGGLVKWASDLGFEAAGLEPAADICELAERLHGVVMFRGTLREHAFPAGSWDVITMHDVLEHVFEPVREIEEIRRVLAPGGIVVIEMPTVSSLNHAEHGAGWSTISPLEHVHLFHERNAQLVVESVGLRVLDLYSPHEDNLVIVGEAP